jgi:hypothetical protein
VATVPSYDALKKKQTELIRKSLDGSGFISDLSAEPIDKLTTVTGTGANAVISLRELPEGWDDLGFLTPDGVAFSRDVSTSEVTSWGSTTPTRTDVITDTSTVTVTAQETKLLTIGMATGADLANFVPDPGTGEVRIAKPVRPKSKHYRFLSLAVDNGEYGEIYIARFLPRAKVSSYAEQSFGQSDDPTSWGVTLTGEVDDELGYSEEWLFGGPGWAPLLEKMGFPALVPAV